MSCGNPHATDCTEVLDAVYSFLDGETDENQRHIIAEHLDECSPCLKEFGIEREVKILVARCCGGEQAPDALRAKIVLRIEEVRIQLAQ